MPPVEEASGEDTIPSVQINQPRNLVTLPDGSKHLFPAGTTKDEMEKALGTYNIKQKAQQATPAANWWDKTVDVARPFIATAAGLGAAGATTLIPGVGESGVANLAAETQGYAAVDALMKYLKTEKPKSMTEALTDSEMDAAMNAVAGKLVQGVWKGAKSMMSSTQLPSIYKLAPTTSQALEAYGHSILSKGTQFLEDYGILSGKAAALNRAGGEGFAEALGYANQMNGRTAAINKSPAALFDKIRSGLMGGLAPDIPELGTTARDVANKSGVVPKLHAVSEEALNLLETKGAGNLDKLDEVIGDRDKLAKVLKVGQVAGSPYMNVKKDLGAYQFMKMIGDAWEANPKGAGGRLDPAKLTKLWNDPEMAENFKTLYGKDGMDRISSFFKDIAYAQTGKNPNQLLALGSKGSFLFGTRALASAIAGGDLAGMIPAGITVGAHAMGKLLTGETTGKIIAEMAHGALQTTNPVWAARMIGTALKGTTVGIQGIDGSSRDGTFVEDENGHLKFEAYR